MELWDIPKVLWNQSLVRLFTRFLECLSLKKQEKTDKNSFIPALCNW